MTRPPRQIKLGAFLMQTGHHIAAWRHPGAQADAAVNFRHYVDLARRAEAAKFDAIFRRRGRRAQHRPAFLSRTARSDHFEPLTLLSALAAVTEKIGLIATVSTTYNEPYHVARKFASLDQISGGRSGWNLVTSSGQGEAQNFSRTNTWSTRSRARLNSMTWCWGCGTAGRTTPSCATPTAASTSTPPSCIRCIIAASTSCAARSTWRARRKAARWWCRPAPRPPAATGRAQRRSHLRGPSDLRRGPVLLSRHQARAAGYGRDPDSIKVMPGIFPWSATAAEADEKFARLQDLIHPVVGVQLLSNMIGVDLSGHPVDGPLPELPETNGGRSRQLLLADLARRDGLTIRQLYLKIAGARPSASGGHARAHRRPVAAMVRGRRRGRLQHHVALAARRPGRFHRTGAAGTAPAWPVPARVRRQHIARAPGSGPAGARAGQRPRAASRHRRLRPPPCRPPSLNQNASVPCPAIPLPISPSSAAASPAPSPRSSWPAPPRPLAITIVESRPELGAASPTAHATRRT